MHNNVPKVISKIFNTIYLSCMILFPSVPRYSITITPLRNIFNFMKFYKSIIKIFYSLIGPWKENLINAGITFAAPTFSFLKRRISANNAFY